MNKVSSFCLKIVSSFPGIRALPCPSDITFWVGNDSKGAVCASQWGFVARHAMWNEDIVLKNCQDK